MINRIEYSEYGALNAGNHRAVQVAIVIVITVKWYRLQSRYVIAITFIVASRHTTEGEQRHWYNTTQTGHIAGVVMLNAARNGNRRR